MIDDVNAAVAFYTNYFGFTLDVDSAPAFAAVTRGNLRLLLSGEKSSGRRPMPDGTKPIPGGWNRIQLEVGSAPEIMVPLMMQPQMMPAVGSWLDRPVNVVNWLHVVGRLKPGTTREQVQSAANALYRHIMADEALNARHRQ